MENNNNQEIKTSENNQNSSSSAPEKSGKKLNRVTSIILVIVGLILSFTCGFFTNCLTQDKPTKVAIDIIEMMQKVGYIYDSKTGEQREITEKDVADALVNALLDQYSAYYTAEEYEAIEREASGKYGGVGLSFFDTLDLAVDQVVMNSPLERAGLRKGDIIKSGKRADSEAVEFTSVEGILGFIDATELNEQITLNCSRGEDEFSIDVKKEDYVRAYVYYCDDEKEYRFTSESGQNPVGNSGDLTSSPITDNSVGYIVLDSFAGSASRQVELALDFMKERGKTKLILDLRDNGGGYMNVLTQIASYFIYNDGAKKSPVAYSKGKTGEEVYSTGTNRFCDFLDNMVILANENTASASECLIGAIVTYGDLTSGVQNIIVERNSSGTVKTYGKGIMQTTYMLKSGGAFKLTTAKIYWPDEATSIHDKGVTPDMGCTTAEKGEGINKALEFFAN